MDPIISFPIRVDDFISTLTQAISAEVIQQLKNRNIPTSPTNNQEELLTREATAEYFHISLPTLNNYTKSGLLKGYRLGNRVFYKRSELEAAPSAIRTTRNSITQNQRRA